jgi:hypothetical protein
MWCRQCQQDVPVLASSDEGKSRCPRCGVDLGIIPVKRTHSHSRRSDDARRVPEPSAATLDDWSTEEQLRQIERTLRVRKKNHRRFAEPIDAKRFRVDGAHRKAVDGRSMTSERVTSAHAGQKPPVPIRDRHTLGFLAWTAMVLGVAALLGGGAALAYSIVGGRPEYWNHGLSLAIGGQIALLAGLVLQFDRVWRENRSAAAKLDRVDDELRDLKTTASLLGTTHSAASGAFYAHYAGGANAQLLLADLKSQLDLLAIKIAQDDSEV